MYPDSHPLRIKRLRAGHSLRGLANLAQVHYLRIFYGERGAQLTEAELARLSGVLRCDISDLQVPEVQHVA